MSSSTRMFDLAIKKTDTWRQETQTDNSAYAQSLAAGVAACNS